MRGLPGSPGPVGHLLYESEAQDPRNPSIGVPPSASDLEKFQDCLEIFKEFSYLLYVSLYPCDDFYWILLIIFMILRSFEAWAPAGPVKISKNNQQNLVRINKKI